MAGASPVAVAPLRGYTFGGDAAISPDNFWPDASRGATTALAEWIVTNADAAARELLPMRSSASHGVAEVKRPGALHHEGVLEHDVAAGELAEVADAGAKQHRYLADAELVDEAEVERLLDDVSAGDGDELVTGARDGWR